MKTKLMSYYQQPDSLIYQWISHLNHHPIRFHVGLFILMLAYPAINVGYQYWQAQQHDVELLKRQEQAQQAQVRLASLTQHQQQKALSESEMLQINQQLKRVIDQFTIQIETIQWQFEGEKSVQLIVAQRSPRIFAFIQALNQLDYIQFQEITLNKLARERLVQLNARLAVSSSKSE